MLLSVMGNICQLYPKDYIFVYVNLKLLPRKYKSNLLKYMREKESWITCENRIENEKENSILSFQHLNTQQCLITYI